MPNGEKPGDAVAEKWAARFEKGRREEERSIDRLDVRADMKSFGEEEISEVIDQRAIERTKQREGSDPPSGNAKAAATILKLLPEGWGRVVVVLAGIAALTFLAAKGFKLF